MLHALKNDTTYEAIAAKISILCAPNRESATANMVVNTIEIPNFLMVPFTKYKIMMARSGRIEEIITRHWLLIWLT